MATIEPALRIVVADAGPIIHLDELGCLDVLNSFTEVLIPPAVWQEIARHRPAALSASPVLKQVAVHNEPDEALRNLGLRLALHSGELQALQLVVEYKATLFLTDDSAARVAATQLGCELHGTVGLILRSVRCGHRTQADAIRLLEAIPTRSTLHLKASLLERVIQLVRQASESSQTTSGESPQ